MGDKMHGRATYTFRSDHPDYAKYVGNYVNGRMGGHGIFTYRDNTVYVGEFANGKFHGQGRKTYPDGRVEEGQWVDDVFQDRRRLSELPNSPLTTRLLREEERAANRPPRT